MNPILSIVIPVYNAEKYLASALDSVFNQSFENYEVIVVNDGSTDNTTEVIHPYIIKNRIKYIKQENHGPSAARNRGIKEATGDFICFLDADDLLLPDCLSDSVAILKEKPDVGILFKNYFKINMGDTVEDSLTGHFEEANHWKLFEKLGGLFPLGIQDVWIIKEAYFVLLLRNFVFLSGTITRRQLLIDLGGFNETMRMGEDRDLWLRIALNAEVAVSKKPGSIYRRRSGSLVENRELFLQSQIYTPMKNYYPENLNSEQTIAFVKNQRNHYYSYAQYLSQRYRSQKARDLLLECLRQIGWNWGHYYIFILMLLPAWSLRVLRFLKQGSSIKIGKNIK